MENMENIENRLFEDGIMIPKLLVPSKNVDIKKWSVIACDQWTQDRDYWKKVEQLVSNAPSTLNMIFPEVYLEDEGRADRIKRIHDTMKSYIPVSEYEPNNVFCKTLKAGAFVSRRLNHGTRYGLVIAVDLEQYDWRPGSKNLIRATEDTIPERIPPRVEVRRDASMELSHTMLLINDKENILISLLSKLMNKAPYAYNSDLMFDSGHICGQLLYRKNDWAFIADSLDHLKRQSCTLFDSENPFLFAVGDGNHSLAASKAYWDEYKTAHSSEKDIMNHPARFALAEIVNLYDPSLHFEPIHRIVFGTSFDNALSALKTLPDFSSRSCKNRAELSSLVNESGIAKNHIGLCADDKFVLIEFEGGKAAAVETQPVLDKLSKSPSDIDYIHGEEELFRLIKTSGGDAAGILMPPFNKDLLFPTVAKSGVLPRKTFSMGEARDKRFYLECRKFF